MIIKEFWRVMGTLELSKVELSNKVQQEKYLTRQNMTQAVSSRLWGIAV